MEGLRQEERESNLRSTIISPGLVNTELYTTIADKKFGESLDYGMVVAKPLLLKSELPKTQDGRATACPAASRSA